MSESKPKPTATRKQWDKDEWAAKAKEKDAESAEKAKAAESAMKQGKKPIFDKEELPKATQALQARTDDLEIEKNLNKTVLVQTTTSGKGPRGAGFFCELCNRTLKDSLSYLDHVNGRIHLRRLGQTTQVSRSTVSQVRAKIASLRAATAQKVTAKNYDFQKRLGEVRQVEQEERARRKEDRKRKREERREEEALGRVGVIGKKSRVHEEGGVTGTVAGGGAGGRAGGARSRDQRRAEKKEEEMVEMAQIEHERVESMMGFGGFGGGRKR